MSTKYTESTLGIDHYRWYYTKFSLERYRQAGVWDSVKESSERTAEAVRAQLEAYRSAGVFGDDELTALKSTIQVSSTIGAEATTKQILQTGGDRTQLERAVELVEAGTGVVSGIPYEASVKDHSAHEILDVFGTLLDEETDMAAVDAAAEQLLNFDFGNVGGGTLSAVLCLLRPTRFPIVNQQTKKVFDSCFDIRLSADPEDYLDSAEQFESIRREFGFDEMYRQLDHFCYWLREEVDPEGEALPENIRNRTVWQISVAEQAATRNGQLWSQWQDLGICSLDGDTGPLTELSASEIEAQTRDSENPSAGDSLHRFVNKVEPRQLVIARQDTEVLGIGVTEQGGYHYAGGDWDTDVEGTEIPHPHIWPVTWEVVLEQDRNRDVSDWEIEPTLNGNMEPFGETAAFEGIRWKLAKQYPGLISPLSRLEDLVLNPLRADLPSEWQTEQASEGGYFILQTGSDEWEDEVGDTYHFRLGLPGSRRLLDAERGQVVFLEDGELYATARVTEIQQEERDEEIHCFASLEAYEPLEPVSINQIRGEFETKISLQHPIIEITATDYRSIPNSVGETRYFWVNSKQNSWYHEGGDVFYATRSSDGTKRKNLQAYERATPGDEVLVYRLSPTKQVVGKGHITEGLHEEVTERHGEAVEGVTIAWDKRIDGPSWDDIESDPELQDSAVVQANNSNVITEVSKSTYQRILNFEPQETFSEYQTDLAVSDEEITIENGGLYFPEDQWQRIQSRIVQALQDGNHVLLFGPPGTGKTKLARQICERTVGEDSYELVTGSADWSTFDTVGGYQTTSANTLEFEPGVVLDRFHADESGTPANEWLIIDELNRADIDKAFGSLFSALTGESVTLPFEGSEGDPIEILDASRDDEPIGPTRYYIPEDWRMLATMNTLDKTSLYEMSYAFMRRWAFIPIGIPDLPDPSDETESGNEELAELVASYVDVWAADGSVPAAEQHYEQVGRIWRAINEHRAIGPAIVEDIYQYVATAPTPEAADYVSPIIMYVFPQLEGLRRSEIERLVERLETIIDDDSDELWEVARDFFQIDLQPETEG